MKIYTGKSSAAPALLAGGYYKRLLTGLAISVLSAYHYISLLG